jgi:hypothetical protein
MRTINVDLPADFRLNGIKVLKKEGEAFRCGLSEEGSELLAQFLGAEAVRPERCGIRIPRGAFLGAFARFAGDGAGSAEPGSFGPRGLDLLPGEFCPYGVRALFNLSAGGAGLLTRFLGLSAIFLRPPIPASSEAGGRSVHIGSILLPSGDLWRDLALYILWHLERSDRVYQEGDALLHGYSTLEVSRFERGPGATVSLLRRLVVAQEVKEG